MNDSSNLLREVFSRVMEKQVFMFADELSLENLAVGEDDWVEAQIFFHGPIDGSLYLSLPKKMQLDIAANFMGMDADDPAVVRCAEDSLKEILNVVCGHVLTGMAGEEPVFDLSIPKVRTLSEEERMQLAAQPDGLAFDVDGSHAILRLQLLTQDSSSQRVG